MMHMVIWSCAKTLLTMMAFLRLAIVILKLIHTVPDKINLRFTRVKCEIFHLTTGECFPVNNQNYRVFAGKLITRNLFSRE